MTHATSLPQNPRLATREECIRARVARTQEEYEALMLQASAIIHDQLQRHGPRHIDRDPETGRIHCRDLLLQEALRTIDEVQPYPEAEGEK